MTSPSEVRVSVVDSADGPTVDGTHEDAPVVEVELNTRATGSVDIEGQPDGMGMDALGARVEPQHMLAQSHGAQQLSQQASQQAAQQSAQQASQQAAQQQTAQASAATDASTTTDPHHDEGSSATGHVEDATPDPRGAGPAEEPEATVEPEPEPEPPPPPAPVEAAHDAAATTEPDSG